MLVDEIEFAYEPITIFEADNRFSFGREPTLRRMPDGSLLSFVYTGGTGEPHPDNVAAMIRSLDDGKTWSKPEIVFKHPSRCTLGTEIFTETDRPFAVFQTFNYSTFHCEMRSFLAYTEDSGKTWSNPQSFPGVPSNFDCRQGKVLSDGSWVFPVYWMEQRDQWDFMMAPGKTMPGPRVWVMVSGVIRSRDRGGSYSLHGGLRTDNWALEPEICELSPGHLKMYLRNAYVLWESDSYDYGVTWTEPRPTDIPNPGSKFVLYKIRGKVILVNNVWTGKQNRKTLELWVGSGDPVRWEKKLMLARFVRPEEEIEFYGGVSQIAYPHGFADDGEETLYLALDGVVKFFMIRIPYRDFLE